MELAFLSFSSKILLDLRISCMSVPQKKAKGVFCSQAHCHSIKLNNFTYLEVSFSPQMCLQKAVILGFTWVWLSCAEPAESSPIGTI